MSLNYSNFTIHVLPRQEMTWREFVKQTPPRSIALDGMVKGGPKVDTQTLHFNYDHHSGVVREATMSTANQVYYAIKGGLVQLFGQEEVNVYINDTDQDTSLAVWLLIHHSLFEGVQSIPHINRLLALNDRWDITGGAFPMNLDQEVIRQHTWVFEPYSTLRKSGALFQANEETLQSNLEAVLRRLDQLLMGQAKEAELDTRYEILFDCPRFRIIDEIGGTEVRFYLFNHGLDAFISLVARRDDGRFVYSIGRRSQYIPFDLPKLYVFLNHAEGIGKVEGGWGGSDIIGGSPRRNGSGLAWEQVRDVVLTALDTP